MPFMETHNATYISDDSLGALIVRQGYDFKEFISRGKEHGMRIFGNLGSLCSWHSETMKHEKRSRVMSFVGQNNKIKVSRDAVKC